MAQGKIHCVFIGIDDYRDAAIPTLYCAGRDAQEMSDLFEGIGADVSLILNSQATLVTMKRALWGLSRRVDINDTAVVYYAGHGARPSVPRRNAVSTTVPCLLPYDAYHDDLVATGIAMDELGRCFESIACKRVLFLFDSCYSGAVVSGRAFASPGERASAPESPVLPTIAGEGTVILAASQEYEPAFEDRDTGHGVFTEFLIEALSGKAAQSNEDGVSLDAVQKYLQEHVSFKTRRKFSNPQTPVQHGTFTERFIFPVMRPSTYRTLASFPHQFLPLTVVVGDRRESAPKTTGDLFALSASPAELRWLLGLRLPHDTEIVSDKVFVQGTEQYLREHFGERNLLVIGSPAANLLTRIVNASGFFPFSIPREAQEQYRRLGDEIREIASNRTALVNFATDPLHRDTLAFYMNLLRKGGFIDPTYNHHRRGDRIPSDRDYGTVTLARNPFSDPRSVRFLTVVAAGVSLPGTMHSLAMLLDARSRFADRPFGGIFAVELTKMEWVLRLTDAIPDWSTEEYDVAKLRRGLDHLKAVQSARDELGEEGINDRLQLLEQITSPNISDLQVTLGVTD